MPDIMLKYGCTEDQIRFEMDDWALVATPVGHEGLDCVHGCHRKDSIGIVIQWSYAIPGDPNCPGCDAVMPDEVQGLFQMANADYIGRIPIGWYKQEIERGVAKSFAQLEKQYFLSGSGYKYDPKEEA
jgi:hypothetical protein